MKLNAGGAKPFANFNNTQETAYLLGKSANAAHLRDSLAHVVRGELVSCSLDELWKFSSHLTGLEILGTGGRRRGGFDQYRANKHSWHPSDKPFSGIGKPEPLLFDLFRYWSRRRYREHRLIYKLSGENVIVIFCRYMCQNIDRTIID